MTHDRLRLLLLTGLMAAVAVTVTMVALTILYHANIATHEERLTDLVASRESFIDAIFRATEGDLSVVQDLLAEVQAEVPGIGTTGEFTIGRRNGSRIQFLIPLRYPIPGGDGRSVAADDLAEPMGRALAGKHGVMVGRDYRGQRVLAAYRPVDGTDWGLVAKIDLAEVRTPIIRAGALSLAATALLVALGAVLFTRITAPVLKEIAASETRFRAIFERSRVGKSLTAPGGELLKVNAAFAEMLGYTVEEIEQVDFSRISHPEDVATSRECVRCLLAGERESYHFEKRYLHRDGHVVYADVNTTLLLDSDGTPLYFITGIIDITKRRRAQQELAELNAQLELKVTERTRELAHTVELLGAANKELESFSYTVSHDLRAPLRAIDGFSRILVDEHGDELSDEARRYLQIVRDNTRQMGQLIDDLLAFSRLSRQELRAEPVALGKVVAEAWAQLDGDRTDRQVELTVGNLPHIEGDPRLLKLVFVNLLGNALKFTRTRAVARIEVASENRDGAVVCYVKDNGVGFDARYSDKLFGVFQRLHRADQFEGTGVGLATVARIIHRHGGRVWGESELDKGATFFLSFDGGDRGTDQSG